MLQQLRSEADKFLGERADGRDAQQTRDPGEDVGEARFQRWREPPPRPPVVLAALGAVAGVPLATATADRPAGQEPGAHALPAACPLPGPAPLPRPLLPHVHPS